MTEHLSTEIVERFHHQALAPGDRSTIYDHVLKCNACRERIIDSNSEPIALQFLSDHLLHSNLDEPFHLDLELVEGYVEDDLDDVDRERAEMHLQRCIDCSTEVTDFRESLATMRAASIQPHVERKSLWERFLAFTRVPSFGSPLRVTAIIALAALGLIAIMVVWRFKSAGPTPMRGEKDLNAESKPTPIPSLPQTGGNVPPPTLGPSPSKLAESTPKKSLNRSSEGLMVLNDGLNKITFERSGKLTGLESLSLESQQAVKEALTTGSVKRPDALDDLRVPETTMRAPGIEEPVRLVYPVKTVILEDAPLMQWERSQGVDLYRVEVGDDRFHQAANSGDLSSSTRSWRPDVPLKRGIVYTWVVQGIKRSAEGGSISSRSQSRFKILEEAKLKELNNLKANSQSHLALGVFYAREGMIAEAEREFQALANDNPRSTLAKKFLKEIQSWTSR